MCENYSFNKNKFRKKLANFIENFKFNKFIQSVYKHKTNI